MKTITLLAIACLCAALCGCEDKAAQQKNIELGNELNGVRLDLGKAEKAVAARDATIAALTNAVARAETRLEQMAGELADAKAEIARLTPDAKRGRALPLKLSTRTAFTDSTIVLRVQNIGPQSLAVKIKFTSATLGSKTFDRVLTGGTLPPVVEIGTREGWQGVAGDVVEISSDGYDTLTTKL